jgi:hypothetical protein
VRERALAVLIGSALAGLVSGCDVHQQLLTSVKDFKRSYLAWRGRVLQSKDKPAETTVAQKTLYESSQLLHEMFQVVLLREPYGPEEFGAYVNTLSQGGSLEGLYNGFVNSEHYRKLESTPAPAYPSTVKVFAQLIAPLQTELTHTQIRPTDLGVSSPYEAAQYEKAFAKASFFELKRYLGNEALKVVEAKYGKGDSREELAKWYSTWVTQMASLATTLKVDFGIPLRNRSDADFHRAWVKSLSSDVASDRVIWEVLNRLHRILNAVEASASQSK